MSLENFEEVKHSRLNPNPERHDGFVYQDQLCGDILDIHSLKDSEEYPSRLVGRLVLEDEHGPLTDEVEVMIEKDQEIMESRALRVWFSEHGKALGVGAGVATVVAVGTLIVRRKLR